MIIYMIIPPIIIVSVETNNWVNQKYYYAVFKFIIKNSQLQYYKMSGTITATITT